MKSTMVICGMILAVLTLASCATNKRTTDMNDNAYKPATVHDYKGERS